MSKKGDNSNPLPKPPPSWSREIRYMMYGFGDEESPLPETVAAVEDIVTEYVTNMTMQAQEVVGTKKKIRVQDLLYLIRKDEPKYQRAVHLLKKDAEIKEVKKTYTMDEEERITKD